MSLKICRISPVILFFAHFPQVASHQYKKYRVGGAQLGLSLCRRPPPLSKSCVQQQTTFLHWNRTLSLSYAFYPLSTTLPWNESWNKTTTPCAIKTTIHAKQPLTRSPFLFLRQMSYRHERLCLFHPFFLFSQVLMMSPFPPKFFHTSHFNPVSQLSQFYTRVVCDYPVGRPPPAVTLAICHESWYSLSSC